MKLSQTITFNSLTTSGKPKKESLTQHLVRLGIKPHIWIMAWYRPSKN